MKIKPVSTSEEIHSESNPEEKLIQSKKKPRPFVLGIFLSVRLFLIVVITLLVIATALSIWIAAYKVNEQAAMESVTSIMNNINDKIRQFLDGQLVPLQVVSQQLRDDYQNGYIDTSDNYLRYFYSKINQNNISIATLCFGENGVDTLYGYTREDGQVSMIRKRQSDRYLLKLATDANGFPTSKIQLNVTNYVVPKRDFYLESSQFFANGYSDGGFGTVNQIPSGHMTIYYASQVYARNSTNKIGIAKINLTFQQIAQFFAGIKVLENGYSMLTEFGNDMIIGCSLPIPNIDKIRIKAQNITIRSAGKVFAKMLAANTELSYVQEGSESLIVSTTSYEFKNLKWRLTLVFDENEIKKGIITSSYVILGVTIGVTCIGVLLSVLIGWMVTNPFIQLQKDFKKIEVLDLANIKPRSSIFTESKSIYSSLTDTVNWLAEFRAFLPDSVLNQLEQTKQDESADEQSEKGHDQSASSIGSTNKGAEPSAIGSSHHGSTFRKPKGGVAAMLKLGLSNRHGCVLYMKIPALNDVNISDLDQLNSTVCKVISGVSSICKTVRGDLQIKSHNEFLIVLSDKNCTLTGLETALKITTALNSLNDNLIRNGSNPLKANIAVASGECLQGNVGNTSLRFFTLVGEMISRAKNLSTMCEEYGVCIIVDQETHKENKDAFVYRPVDRYLGGNGSISTVYELIKKNQINADEWLYELEQQKENTKFEVYSQQFSKLFSQTRLEGHDIMAIKNVLEENKIPNDLLMERLIKVIEKSCMNDYNTFVNYHSRLKSSIDTYIDHNVPLSLE